MAARFQLAGRALRSTSPLGGTSEVLCSPLSSPASAQTRQLRSPFLNAGPGHTLCSTSPLRFSSNRNVTSKIQTKSEPLVPKVKDPPMENLEFQAACNSSYLRIDLDAIAHNVRLLKGMCSPHTEIMAVLKGNAYGHGGAAVARWLQRQGLEHWAVGTPREGVALRQAGMDGLILVFGSNVESIPLLKQYQLTPTMSSSRFLEEWVAANEQEDQIPQVVIKLDTGMSRHGCQPHELPVLVKTHLNLVWSSLDFYTTWLSLFQRCRQLSLPVHSVMTHFAQAWNNHTFTTRQMDVFLKATDSLRREGVKIHVANSPAMFQGVGVDLDFARPGSFIYGLPPNTSDDAVKMTSELGFRPALSWIARPTLMKDLPAGRHVGYDLTYTVQRQETTMTFNFGFADGYDRRLSQGGVLKTVSGQQTPVIGLVSMDTVTTRGLQGTSLDTSFLVYADDFTSPNCVTAIAKRLNTIPAEICCSLAARLPRVYVTNGGLFSG